jgi:hypothetical protein
MATFLMFGKYSSRALQEMSIQRTHKAVGLVRQFGGRSRRCTTPGQQDRGLSSRCGSGSHRPR